jgi:RluA family pseudouridine synthase
VIAINKPPGLPSQATKDQSVLHVLPCLEKILKEKGGKKRKLVLVHRLDKETSGILLIADGNERATWLTDQFRDRSVEKIYWAICHGIPKADEFAESAPLTPIDQRTGDVRAVRSGGKPAVTEFRTLAVNKELGLSLIECRPKTGRSHQLRVHLDINGLPIVGDKRYGGAHAKKPLPPALAELTQAHHMLHAARLSFQPAPDAARATLNAAPPERFRKLLEAAALRPSASSGNS